MWRYILTKDFMGQKAGILVEAQDMPIIEKLEGDDKNPPVGERFYGSRKGILLVEPEIEKKKPELKPIFVPKKVEVLKPGKVEPKPTSKKYHSKKKN